MTRKGCMRFNARRDATEEAIVRDLMRCGASVERLTGRRGLPDLLVGYQGQTYLIECKCEGKRLSPDQEAWHGAWRGADPTVATCSMDALRFIGAVK